jgi:hypothetical protein
VLFVVAGAAAGGLSPTELLNELIDLRGQVKRAERETERSAIATDQLMKEVEAKAAFMQEQQVHPPLRYPRLPRRLTVSNRPQAGPQHAFTGACWLCISTCMPAIRNAERPCCV